MRDDSLGILCKQNKTFYYLETGTNYVGNTIDRIRKTLVTRGLIHFNQRGIMSTDDFTVLTVRDAKVNDYTMEPVYISAHIKNLMETKTDEGEQAEAKSSHWGSSKTPKAKTTKTKAKAKTKTVKAKKEVTEEATGNTSGESSSTA
tara:strand:- start:1623 stop:2060 length:438 start_codon:yes stop_codon:yes gene_type:complete